MKKTVLAAIMMFLILSPIGCGHSSSSPSIFTSFITSDAAFDGDIEDVSGSLFITRVSGGAQSVFAGLDFIHNTEFRAFLDFPLTSVPGNAGIDSAILDIGINSVILQSGNTIPIRIDLIDIFSSTLTTGDYSLINRPPLASITLNIFQSDIGHFVKIDVTSLMIEAQNRGLTDFRIRILEDLGPVIPGLIEIDETATAAPQLQVNYF